MKIKLSFKALTENPPQILEYKGILVIRDWLILFFEKSSSWLVTWRFCVIREEPDLWTDIRDQLLPLYSAWFSDASPPNGQSRLSRVT